MFRLAKSSGARPAATAAAGDDVLALREAAGGVDVLALREEERRKKRRTSNLSVRLYPWGCRSDLVTYMRGGDCQNVYRPPWTVEKWSRDGTQTQGRRGGKRGIPLFLTDFNNGSPQER